MRSRHPETIPLLIAALDPLQENPIDQRTSRRCIECNQSARMPSSNECRRKAQNSPEEKRLRQSVKSQQEVWESIQASKLPIPDLCELLSWGPGHGRTNTTGICQVERTL